MRNYVSKSDSKSVLSSFYMFCVCKSGLSFLFFFAGWILSCSRFQLTYTKKSSTFTRATSTTCTLTQYTIPTTSTTSAIPAIPAIPTYLLHLLLRYMSSYRCVVLYHQPWECTYQFGDQTGLQWCSNCFKFSIKVSLSAKMAEMYVQRTPCLHMAVATQLPALGKTLKARRRG